MTKLKEYIKESLDSPFICESKEECLQKYGKIVFGEQFSKKEKNTDKEEDVVKMLRKYVGADYGEYLNPNLQKALTDLKACFKNNKTLSAPKSSVYRGMSFKEKDDLNAFLRKSLNINKKFWGNGRETENFKGNEVVKNTVGGSNVEYFAVIKDAKYTPKYTVESWTTDKDLAVSFAKTNIDKKRPKFMVLIKNKNSRKPNFIFTPETLDKISLSDWEEEETLCIKKSNTMKIKTDVYIFEMNYDIKI